MNECISDNRKLDKNRQKEEQKRDRCTGDLERKQKEGKGEGKETQV